MEDQHLITTTGSIMEELGQVIMQNQEIAARISGLVLNSETGRLTALINLIILNLVVQMTVQGSLAITIIFPVELLVRM